MTVMRIQRIHSKSPSVGFDFVVYRKRLYEGALWFSFLSRCLFLEHASRPGDFCGFFFSVDWHELNQWKFSCGRESLLFLSRVHETVKFFGLTHE